jgi:hypothetical protein
MRTTILPLTVLCTALMGYSNFSLSQQEEIARPTTMNTAAIGSTTAPEEDTAIDIGLVEFDPGIPADAAKHARQGIFPKIRRSEARYLPYALRQTLVESNHWGAVRVLPEADSSSNLLIIGTILQSDGVTLRLHIRATDSSGRLWLDQEYGESTAADDYGTDGAVDKRPFQDLYNQLANDLYQQLRLLNSGDLRQVKQLSELRYAQSLAPDAFAGYVQELPEGRYGVARLPARNDPMLERIERIRNQEYVFIDTVDDEYAALYSDMTPTYDLWRRFNREQALYQEARADRLAAREKEDKGSYAGMKQSYNAFKWAKMQEQELRELALGFHNEVAPTSMEVQGRVVRLSGSLSQRYGEWRKILRQIYEIETGS